MSKVVWKGSTNLITLGKDVLLRDELLGTVVPDADVEGVVYNETQNVTVGTYSMDPVEKKPGRYIGVIPYDESNLEIGDGLRIEIFADAGSAKKLTIAMRATVKKRAG